MDELPELRSDEEVDALLARLRTKVAPPTPHASPAPIAPDSSSHAFTDFLAAHEEATKTMARALHVLAEAVEELDIEEGPRAQGSGLRARASSGARGLRPGASSTASRRRERRR